MARELKFRVWDGEQMISPDYINRKGFACWKSNSIPETTDKVMQFTGLLDKNGKEIYEGDIVKMPLNFSSYEFMPPYHPTGHDGYGSIDCIGEIIFSNSSFVFNCKKVLKETSAWHDEYNLTKHFMNKEFDIKGAAIIGNIYENAELIKC